MPKKSEIPFFQGLRKWCRVNWRRQNSIHGPSELDSLTENLWKCSKFRSPLRYCEGPALERNPVIRSSIVCLLFSGYPAAIINRVSLIQLLPFKGQAFLKCGPHVVNKDDEVPPLFAYEDTSSPVIGVVSVRLAIAAGDHV